MPSGQLDRFASVALAGLLSFACLESADGASESVATSTEAVTSCVEIDANADATLSHTQMRKNFGGKKTLEVGGIHESLVAFGLGSIPRSARLESATLELYVSDADGRGFLDLHRVTSSWAESTVTFANFGQRFDRQVLGRIPVKRDNVRKAVDVTLQARHWVSGVQPNYGFLLEGNGCEDATLVSREGGTPRQRPHLTVCYTVPDDHCASNPCRNGGTCQNDAAGFTCECAAGYTGDTCETNIDDCASSPCQNGGTCTDEANGYSCNCALGFAGSNCETNVDECQPSPCQNGGVCEDGAAAYSCHCLPGFTGTQCEAPVDSCASGPCQNGGTCANVGNGYFCSCRTGFVGTDCEINVDDCASQPCHNGGTCVDGINAYACVCPPDWGGPACDTNLNTCSQRPCLNGGVCSNGFGTYTCACPPGFAGGNCEVDIDDCVGNRCENGGLCVDGTNSFTCSCPDGFTGERCESRSSTTATWVDDAYTATVTIVSGETGARTYTLSTNAPLRDNEPSSSRTFAEEPGWPVLRSGHDMLDALYALSLEETRELSVDSLHDETINGGAPIDCPSGGCLEASRDFSNPTTRDVSYATYLGLAALTPLRAKNSLLLKLSGRRGGGDVQILQDPGSGGSYPVSSDRVAWALGAVELLKYLEGADRTAFRDVAFDAIVNTAEHDRRVVFDQARGLYRGETSFLDWREQTYAAWAGSNLAHIAMSEALSTNVLHEELLEAAAALADEKGLTVERDKYRGWASALAQKINDAFWQNSSDLYGTYLSTELDPSLVTRFDLLGNALVVTSGVANSTRAKSVVQRYPHFPKGAPVIWPEQDVAIYHNRAIWPFVTGLWLRSARRAENAEAIVHGVRSLIRGSALNLSNMQDFEAVAGAAYLDDGVNSGPVVNSQRQLGSVAALVSMVHDTIFGLEANQTGVRFAPYLPSKLRDTLFAGTDRIALSNFPYKGKALTIVLVLGDAAGHEALVPESVTLDGRDVGLGFIAADALTDGSVIEVTLAGVASTASITALDADELGERRNLFGPSTPTAIISPGGLLSVALNAPGEAVADITFNVYRDGVAVASGLPGSTTLWTDPGSINLATQGYCYSVEAVFNASGNHSQHASPACWWGPASNRIWTVDARSFVAIGGTLASDLGRFYYDGWGEANHRLTLNGVVPSYTGPHYIQLLFSNGSASLGTGITCAVKRMEVFDGATRIASGYVSMPTTGTWQDFAESSLVSANLVAGRSYTVVISEDSFAANMSERAFYSTYTGAGGTAGRFNRANVAELRLFAR